MLYGRDLKIYLAGAMSGLTYDDMNKWREILEERLKKMAKYSYGCDAYITNPVSFFNFDKPCHKTEREIMLFDLNRVKKSDVILVNIDKLNASIGTAMELYEAYKCGIPVIAFDCNNAYDDLHPWLKECITRVEKDAVAACDYIGEFYMR